GWGLWGLVSPGQFSPAAGFSAFAPLYLLAQGIERLLEPFTKFLGSSDDDGTRKRISNAKAEEARNEAIVALAMNPHPTRDLEAGNSQAVLERTRKNRTVISWGIASALGMLACGAFGIRLLQATGFNVPVFWDIAITGLAVGSGTKPLHDLIDNLQK